MNRIILIGNGFDLAHGIETSYSQFIDSLWEQKKDLFEKYCNEHSITIPYQDEEIMITNIERWATIRSFEEKHGYDGFIDSLTKGHNRGKVQVTNEFLQEISKKRHLQNWVDIEEEYYTQLLACIKKHSVERKIEKLNQDFESIKKALEQYLKNKTENIKIISAIGYKIYRSFEKKDFSEEYPEQILFLNFNYTGTAHEYIKFQPSFSNKTIKCDVIHIHGELGNPNNPIIFGYGDEIGKEYLTIENLNDNAYLDNMKTIKYSETDNYKRLSNFINLNEYCVSIMGHSCGKSDRTLLKWIFEHKNCVSIKAFYHYDGLTRKDDFSDKIKNISRLFSDKTMMREKIVSKKDTCTLDGYHIGN